jgi:hypothetical protein
MKVPLGAPGASSIGEAVVSIATLVDEKVDVAPALFATTIR